MITVVCNVGYNDDYVNYLGIPVQLSNRRNKHNILFFYGFANCRLALSNYACTQKYTYSQGYNYFGKITEYG